MAVDLPIVVGGGLLRVPNLPQKIVTTARVGAFICPTNVGHYSVTGLGMKPKAVEFFIAGGSGYNAWFTNCSGFADDAGYQNVSIWTQKGYGQAETDKCLRIFNSLVQDQLTATLVSMDLDGFTLNFTVVNSGLTIRWKASG